MSNKTIIITCHIFAFKQFCRQFTVYILRTSCVTKLSAHSIYFAQESVLKTLNLELWLI